MSLPGETSANASANLRAFCGPKRATPLAGKSRILVSREMETLADIGGIIAQENLCAFGRSHDFTRSHSYIKLGEGAGCRAVRMNNRLRISSLPQHLPWRNTFQKRSSTLRQSVRVPCPRFDSAPSCKRAGHLSTVRLKATTAVNR